jgi:predicted AlkP superfamily phosphohydrolase/phosphomutase
VSGSTGRSQGPLILIGFDAAEITLVQRGIDEGWLPTIASLLRLGQSVRLEPPERVFPGAAWASTMTGTRPHEHQTILDVQLVPGSYRLDEMRADDIKRPPFWRYLSDAGMPSTVSSIYGAPLLPAFDGTQVVGWGTLDPEAMKSRSFRSDPPGVLTQLRKIGGRRDPRPHVKTPQSPQQLRRYRDRLLRGIEGQTAGTKLLLNRRPFDFFHVSFNDAHPAGHLLWHLTDPAHPQYDPTLNGDLDHSLLDIYRAIDGAIAELLRDASPDTTVFILTPHGMGPNPAPGNALEVALERGGWLVRGGSEDADDRRTLWLRKAYRLGRLVVPPVLRPLVNALVPRPGGIGEFAYNDIDWKATRAFELNCDGISFIRLNLANREPSGIVEPGDEYERLCTELQAFLEELRYADSGARAAARITRTCEIIGGPVRDVLPDLCVEWHPRPIGRLRHPDLGVFDVGADDPRTGHHRPSGFLIGAGPAIAASDATELAECEATLLDIAPTMLARLGVPVPTQMKGRPMEVFCP